MLVGLGAYGGGLAGESGQDRADRVVRGAVGHSAGEMAEEDVGGVKRYVGVLVTGDVNAAEQDGAHVFGHEAHLFCPEPSSEGGVGVPSGGCDAVDHGGGGVGGHGVGWVLCAGSEVLALGARRAECRVWGKGG